MHGHMYLQNALPMEDMYLLSVLQFLYKKRYHMTHEYASTASNGWTTVPLMWNVTQTGVYILLCIWEAVFGWAFSMSNPIWMRGKKSHDSIKLSFLNTITSNTHYMTFVSHSWRSNKHTHTPIAVIILVTAEPALLTHCCVENEHNNVVWIRLIMLPFHTLCSSVSGPDIFGLSSHFQ